MLHWCVNTYMHTYIHRYMNTHARTHIYIYIYIYILIHILINILILLIHILIYILIHTLIHILIFILIHIHTDRLYQRLQRTNQIDQAISNIDNQDALVSLYESNFFGYLSMLTSNQVMFVYI